MRYIITGAGTGVGKTHIACAMLREWRGKGREAMALKPVISGFDEACLHESDTGKLLDALGKPLHDAEIETVSPWRFAAPLSPNMAARREDREVTAAEVTAYIRSTAAHLPASTLLLVEGVGGVRVPLNACETFLEVMHPLSWPVVLVAGSYLGALSHSLTAIDSLARSGIEIACVVVSESGESSVDFGETVEALRGFLPDGVTLLAVPRHGSVPPLTAWMTV